MKVVAHLNIYHCPLKKIAFKTATWCAMVTSYLVIKVSKREQNHFHCLQIKQVLISEFRASVVN